MLLGWYFIPQHLNSAFIPLVASIWVRVRELEADIVVHQPLVHQTLEATFTKCIIKVFYIVSGIAGEKTFDFEKEKEVSILNDPEYLGNYTKENYSPKNLFSHTMVSKRDTKDSGPLL